MKPKTILAILLLAATFALFWLFKPKPISSSLGEESLALTNEILSFGPRPPGSAELDSVRSHLGGILESSGWDVRHQVSEQQTPIGKIVFKNLRARLKIGDGDPWKRQITGLLCAHIDSKYFEGKTFLGADDAASACAAVVTIGNYFAKNNPQLGSQIEIVLFDGEEAFQENMTILDGLYGSRSYANGWRGRHDKPTFGILLDMIGHKDLQIRIPADSPPHLAELMFETAKKQGVATHFGTAPGPIMDDHVPLNLVGIPTIDVIGDFMNKPWWHTAGDNSAIISKESLSISIHLVIEMLEELIQP